MLAFKPTVSLLLHQSRSNLIGMVDNEVACFIKDAEPQLIVCDPRSMQSTSSFAAECNVSRVLTLDVRGKSSFIDQLDGVTANHHTENCAELARFKQPKQILLVDELPRNTMGKEQKKALREKYRDTYNG